MLIDIASESPHVHASYIANGPRSVKVWHKAARTAEVLTLEEAKRLRNELNYAIGRMERDAAEGR